MGSTGARMFVPPLKDPPNPNVHPIIWRQLNVLGTRVAMALEERGKTGVQHGEIFTAWWTGASIHNPWWHNQVGMLFELASARIASPIYIDPTEVDQTLKMNLLSPWKEGVTDSFGPLAPLRCLGFLKGSNCPHYDGESDRRPAYHRLVGRGLFKAGLAADDGVALHFTGTRIAAIVSSRPKAKAYRIEKRNGRVVETPLLPVLLPQ